MARGARWRAGLHLPEKHGARAVSGAVWGLRTGPWVAGDVELEHIVPGGKTFLHHSGLGRLHSKASAQKLISRALK